MHFGHQRTSRVDHAKLTQVRLFAHGWGYAMRAEDQHRPDRHILDRFDKDRSAAPQLVDHVAVMNDLVVHINWGTIGLYG